jgi:hypothetical protein
MAIDGLMNCPEANGQKWQLLDNSGSSRMNLLLGCNSGEYKGTGSENAKR